MLNSGVFLIDKPTNMTSNDVIQKIKRKFKIKKIGHAGTLDPLATGVLVVLTNSATKLSDFLLNSSKEYEVTMKLFIETDTGDTDGQIINEMEPTKLSKTLIKEIFEKYNGYIYNQKPPDYSAIKVNGKKLYEYARSGNIDEIEIKTRKITIESCILDKFDSKNNEIKFTVQCSKGTYVRSLVTDIAKDLEVIATVSELRRTKSGNFSIQDAHTIEETEESNLINMYETILLTQIPMIEYHNENEIKYGKSIKLINQANEFVFIINKNKDVLAVYRRVAQDLYVCQRGLWEEEKNVKKTEAEKEGFY